MVAFNVPSSSSEQSSSSSEEDQGQAAAAAILAGPSVLTSIFQHENIVNFEIVDADDPTADPDGPEDPDHDYDPEPEYIERFTDIRTLAELISREAKPPGIPTSKGHPGVSEPLVWHVLMSVLKALCYLHEGHKLPTGARRPPEDWEPIVHNAVQPEKIIFTHPIAKKSKHLAFRYGRCKLGDFSSSVVLQTPGWFGPDDEADLTDRDRNNIVYRREQFEYLYYAGERTGFEAPEIIGDDFREIEYPAPWSDLWSLGAVAINMMTGRSIWDLVLEVEFEDRALDGHDTASLPEHWRHADPRRRHRKLRKYLSERRITRLLPKIYSNNLRFLVLQLLDPEPRRRGLALHVLEEVELMYQSWCKKGFKKDEVEALIAEGDAAFDKKLMHDMKEQLKMLQGLR